MKFIAIFCIVLGVAYLVSARPDGSFDEEMEFPPNSSPEEQNSAEPTIPRRRHHGRRGRGHHPFMPPPPPPPCFLDVLEDKMNKILDIQTILLELVIEATSSGSTTSENINNGSTSESSPSKPTEIVDPIPNNEPTDDNLNTISGTPAESVVPNSGSQSSSSDPVKDPSTVI